MQSLAKEMETYQEKLPSLLSNGEEGKFVLIRETEVAGVFSSFEDGLRVGTEKFGTAPFMVKKIEARETVYTFTGGIVSPCPTS